MRGSVRYWSGAVVFVALGACSNIIGVSEIEIDPSLDGEGGSGGTGGSSQGGKSSGGSTVIPDAGEPNGGTAGAPQGGTSSGGTSGGGTAGAGEAGAGGEPTSGCPNDCDDEITCTIDECLPSGECRHTADDTACTASACESCVAGIGCVAGPKKTENLLLDGGFDDGRGDWDDASPANIVADATAPSPPNSLKLGPAAANAIDYLYADIFQWVTIPERIVALDMEVTYQFVPGMKNVDEEYAVIALYPEGEIDPFTQFHEFEGADAAQPTWKTVTFSAPASEVRQMGGLDFSFDFVGHSFDGVYRFDNVKLNATYCE